MSTPRNPAGLQTHRTEWDDRLLDWLDGDLDAAQSAALEAHVESCDSCRERLSELEALDRTLLARTPQRSLDAAFDERLLGQIEAMDESQRAAARRRAREDFEQSLAVLSKRWRRNLGLVISGALAGIALALALTSYFESAPLTQMLLAEGASELGRDASNLIQLMLTGMFGAAIGGAVARWLATTAD